MVYQIIANEQLPVKSFSQKSPKKGRYQSHMLVSIASITAQLQQRKHRAVPGEEDRPRRT